MTSITSPLSLLSLPHVRPDTALRTVLEIQANALLASLPQPDPFMQSLHERIVALLQEGEPTLERTASRLYLSARTLHRRLAERGFWMNA